MIVLINDDLNFVVYHLPNNTSVRHILAVCLILREANYDILRSFSSEEWQHLWLLRNNLYGKNKIDVSQSRDRILLVKDKVCHNSAVWSYKNKGHSKPFHNTRLAKGCSYVMLRLLSLHITYLYIFVFFIVLKGISKSKYNRSHFIESFRKKTLNPWFNQRTR